MNEKSIAYAWRNGQIDIGLTLPDGALPIVSGEAEMLKKAIIKTASVHNQIVMVPGITSAFREDERIDLLIDYKQKVDEALKVE